LFRVEYQSLNEGVELLSFGKDSLARS